MKPTVIISILLIFVIANAPAGAEITNINATPTLVAAGQPVTVTFLSSTELQPYPVVTIGGQAMALMGINADSYTYEYVVTGDEADDFQDVVISAVDLGSNPQIGLLSNAVRYDFTAPQISNITADPTEAKAGDTVSVTFQPSEALQSNPAVAIGGQAMTLIGTIAGVYTYEYVVTGSEAEGEQEIVISCVDLVGNTGSGILSTAIFDFTAPQISNITSNPAVANAGNTVTVTFTVSETVQNYPAVIIGGRAMSFVSLSFDLYTYEYVADGTEAEGLQDVSVSVIDAAGNIATGHLDGTTTFFWDYDGDGVGDAVEAAGPNSGDGNSDGEQDYVQAHVTSLRADGSSQYVTLESPIGTSLADCQLTDNPSPNDAPTDVEFGHGFISFTINGIAPGGATSLTIYLPDGSTPNAYYKYGGTPDDPQDHWYAFLFDGDTGAEFNGNTITLWFIDAERGDDNFVQDGAIVDLGAPGYIDDGSDGGSGGGGGGGCFIKAITTAFH